MRKAAIVSIVLAVIIIVGLAVYFSVGSNAQNQDNSGDGLNGSQNRIYIVSNATACAATDWICDSGYTQFYDETGCGCEMVPFVQNRSYVGRTADECARTQVVCAAGYQPFKDETGCGCEKIQRVSCGPRNNPDRVLCIQVYDPVCGFFSDGSAKTYSNSCVACGDNSVIEYLPGECEIAV